MVRFIITKVLIILSIVLLVACSNENRTLYRVQENGLYGFIDSIGNVIIKPQYKYAGNFNDEGYATVICQVKLNTKKNILESNDTTVIIKYGFIDKNNKLVVDTIHCIELTKYHTSFLGLMEPVELVNSFRTSRTFSTGVFDTSIKLNSGRFVIQDPQTHLMGYMDLKGDTIISAKYSYCRPFYSNVATVKRVTEGNDVGYDVSRMLNTEVIINSEGQERATDGYFFINNFYGENSWAQKLIPHEDGIEGYWLLLDKNGRICSDTIAIGRNVIKLYNNSKSDWYVWEYELSILGNKIGTYYSFINKKGQFLTDKDYDGELTLGHETFNGVTSIVDSIVGIKMSYNDIPGWAFANEKLEFQSQPFDSLFQFTDGLAAVKEFSETKTDSKWGFVDKEYNEIIPYKYDKVGKFHKGLAYFRISNIEGYINRKGDVVWCTERHE